MKTTRLIALTLAVGGGLGLGASGVFAADHIEAPGTQNDTPGDITDFYAWHTDDNKLVAVIDFDGLKEAGTATGTYDPDMLYGVHIDSDGDNVADIDVWVRFGQNGEGEWGMQVTNLPGAGEDPVVGPVETEIDAGNGLRVFAGLRDDPFFFDLDGYLETLMSGTLSFDSANDSFAGTNVTSIVLEMDATMAAGGGTTLQTWATSARRGN
ncbi:MAG: DUF4331 domain-containing protein [Deltaproteobacteria bacterium]|nr:DUF4331 domain-containing protein [Deltaproteobacteria bacterium]